eukprot:7297675-Prymnesium_polylepis.2
MHLWSRSVVRSSQQPSNLCRVCRAIWLFEIRRSCQTVECSSSSARALNRACSKLVSRVRAFVCVR